MRRRSAPDRGIESALVLLLISGPAIAGMMLVGYGLRALLYGLSGQPDDFQPGDTFSSVLFERCWKGGVVVFTAFGVFVFVTVFQAVLYERLRKRWTSPKIESADSDSGASDG